MSFQILLVDKHRAQTMIDAGVWNDSCPLHYTELRIINLEHTGFDGRIHTGELVVWERVADKVTTIFKKLLELKFPIEKIKCMEDYGGDDVASMLDNNSSAFNGRKIMHTDRWSSHAYGAAIDINPFQNPYLKLNESDSTIKVYPEGALHYVNRNKPKPGMVEDIVALFADHGFTVWGGHWENKPDYHHFQLPWKEIERYTP